MLNTHLSLQLGLHRMLTGAFIPTTRIHKWHNNSKYKQYSRYLTIVKHHSVSADFWSLGMVIE